MSARARRARSRAPRGRRRDDAGEEAGGALRDGEVRRGRRRRGTARARSRGCRPRCSARIIAKAERSMPSGRRPAPRTARDDVRDHVAAGRDEHDALARALGRLDDAERLEVEDRLVERHRDLVLRRGSAPRPRAPSRRSSCGSSSGADDDLLVGDADADALAEALVLAEQGARAPRPGLDVGDLAVAHDARLERRERRCSTVMRPLTATSAAVMPLGSMSSPTRFFGALCHGPRIRQSAGRRRS